MASYKIIQDDIFRRISNLSADSSDAVAIKIYNFLLEVSIMKDLTKQTPASLELSAKGSRIFQKQVQLASDRRSRSKQGRTPSCQEGR